MPISDQGCVLIKKVHILQFQWWWTKFTCGPTSWWWLWRWLSLRHVFFSSRLPTSHIFPAYCGIKRKWMYDNLCIIFECQDLIASLQMIKTKNVFDPDNIGNVTQLWLTHLTFVILDFFLSKFLSFCPFCLSCGLLFSFFGLFFLEFLFSLYFCYFGYYIYFVLSV